MLKKSIMISILCVVLSGCLWNTKPNDPVPPPPTTPPEEVAKCVVKPDLELPDPLNLTPYQVDVSKFDTYVKDNTYYIGIPEMEVIRQSELLLLLKNRIYELQEIIVDYNNVK